LITIIIVAYFTQLRISINPASFWVNLYPVLKFRRLGTKKEAKFVVVRKKIKNYGYLALCMSQLLEVREEGGWRQDGSITECM
jgi:hypothetical protein